MSVIQRLTPQSPWTPNTMKKLPVVAVIQTAWGSKFGGINSFSTELCRALAETLIAHRIVCVCLNASNEDHANARGSGVTLISLNVPDGKGAEEIPDNIRAAFHKSEIEHVEWWIGHDVITGPHALGCKERVQGSRAAVLMHMSYSDYAFIKHAPEDAAIIAQRTEAQRTTLSSADVGFAVGPLLFDRLIAIRDRASFMVVPGLVDLAPTLANPDRLHAITFGRFDSSESLIKQAPLVVAAFARAFRIGVETNNLTLKGARLRLIGTPNEVIVQLRALANLEAGRVVNIEAHDFIDDKAQLQRLLHECNICLMLSWHEGFGLSGWEAVGSGVPLIVSRNSGLYQLLHSLGGAATGCVTAIDVRGQADGQPNQEDIEAAKAALLTVSADIRKAQKDAIQLRHLLRFTHAFTWDRAARDVAIALGLQITTTLLDSISGAGGNRENQRSVSESADIETARRVITSADSHYQCGEYIQALETIESLRGYACISHAPELALDAVLKEAEICMRLSRYPPAMALVRRVAREAQDRSDWLRYIRALQVENVILRDQGHYADAVTLARKLLSIAEQKCQDRVDSVLRDLARSLALAGLCDEAVVHGMSAFEAAKNKGDKIAEAKASLAMGEAHRHGRNDASAIRSYSEAREISRRAGHVDCFLWSALGLSDSWFLQGELHASAETLDQLQSFLRNSGHTHPLEALHIRLSLCAIQIAQGIADDEDIRTIVSGYSDLDISWPAEYFQLLQQSGARIPRRF